MLKIGFIFPSSEYLHDPFRGDPHTHFQILTVLEEHFGNAVDLTLVDLRGIKKEYALYHIPECDVYLHSVYTLDYEEQLAIVKGLRERHPKARHIAGGPHAAVFREECSEIFDALIIGDGEETIVAAVNDVISGGLKTTYLQKTILDINRYHYPLRRYLPAGAVARKGVLRMKTHRDYGELLSTTVMFSRGCPHSCSFCAMPQIKAYAPGIRYRAPKLIEEEIEYLKHDYGIRAISLLDEIGIPPGIKQAAPHLEAIGRSGIVWKAQCRSDGMTPEIAALAKDTGCAIMCFGVESVVQRSLDIINKHLDVAKARESIRLMKKAGIECRVYMILGLPAEPEDIVNRMWEFIKETAPDVVFLSLLTIRPGTAMYENPKRFGIKSITSDWSKTMHLYSRYGNETPSLSFEYEEQAPWGHSLSNERIIANYLELQSRLKAHGLARP